MHHGTRPVIDRASWREHGYTYVECSYARHDQNFKKNEESYKKNAFATSLVEALTRGLGIFNANTSRERGHVSLILATL